MRTAQPADWDAIIVGGGPAGLSAALLLGRCGRRVLVCDDGHPRNESSKALNGFLSRDGIPPAEFLNICREQLNRYKTVEHRRAKAVSVSQGADEFALTLENHRIERGRFLLLATGLSDQIPPIEGLAGFYGRSAHSCPYCHGWECRGKPLAVLGGDKEAAELALELLIWSEDVILCCNGPLVCDADVQDRLAQARMIVIEKPIVRIEGLGTTLESVLFADHSRIKREVIFFSPKQIQHSSLAKMLNCEVCAEDGCIQCKDGAATSVPGLYAAGNASRGVQLAMVAAAEGTLAGVAINNALLEADQKRGIYVPGMR